MEIKKIKQLVAILREGGLSRLELTEGEDKVVIEMPRVAGDCGRPAYSAESSVSVTDKAGCSAPLSRGGAIGESNSSPCPQGLKEVKSPIVGVFYASPSPGAEPFVGVGSRIKRGDVLCVIEAMKLMNEIVAECDGEIAEVCISNGDVVEYGQVLFKIR